MGRSDQIPCDSFPLFRREVDCGACAGCGSSARQPHVDRNYSVVFALVLPELLVVATRWGITGVAAAWLIAYPVLFALLSQRYVLRTLEISAWSFLKELWPATSSAVAMTLPVLAIDHYLPRATPALLRLGLMTVAGGVTYAAMMRVFHRSSFDGAIRSFSNRGLSTSPAAAAATAPGASIRTSCRRADWRVADSKDVVDLLVSESVKTDAHRSTELVMRILFVEDDAQSPNRHRRSLAKAGLAVDVAATGEDATRLSRINEYDVAVLTSTSRKNRRT